MQPAPIPANDDERVRALDTLEILNTPPEERFDRIVRVAQQYFDVPMAYISLVDADRQWFKSQCGMDRSQTPRDVSFCGHAIFEEKTLIVPDAVKDPRFEDNPLVTGPPHIRFYVGHPLSGPDDYKVGTLCIAAHEPRDIDPDDLEVLRDLGAIVEKELSLVDIISLQHKLLEASEEIKRKHEENERLLLNILPGPIAERLKGGEATIADAFLDVTVLFSDLVGFTELTRRIDADALVGLLNKLFSEFDALSVKFGVEKIKTIGDAYMAVAGLPVPRDHHTRTAMEMAVAMLSALERFNGAYGVDLQLRIGLNSGPAVAGVIGTHKFIYDLWGDAVNMAARMEHHGLPGRIHVTEAVYETLRNEYRFESRGEIHVKGCGLMTTYMLAS